ncbi:MAG TPA: 2-oxoacid:ferredoxin oxidoreductase subunit beta [Bacteroidales bacterium]|nr:2-oxoacid:ferredoxin oxidoreductase subunit beta [Bacteroidales bacterium]HPI86272.1 2-oxoacid:ferredoxin oxidoreductase subunit beta [Bacteroidales bacterium]
MSNREFNQNVNVLTKEDFKSPGPVKWCAGCGDYAILAAVNSILVDLGGQKEDIVFVSGIGCSSRFPYYINTYGFHGMHGRGAAIASGIKIANPRLQVWHITGDGDSMAIGGNHFIHTIRRNIDMNIIIFNNKIYGLTKGQYSPTSPKGLVTKSSPEGVVENPFTPGELVMGAQGTFFARAVDTDPKMLKEVIKAAALHKGTSVVEVLQNCVIFNNQIHSMVSAKETKEDHTIYLEAGKPMIFGKERNKGITVKNNRLQVATIGENGVKESDVLVHDPTNPNDMTHYTLVRMGLPEFPVAMGVIRSCDCMEPYDELYERQIAEVKQKSRIKCMDDLLNSGNVLDL